MKNFHASRVLLAVTLTLLTTAPALAQAPGGFDRSDLENWYQVELIIFRQADLHGEERHPRDPELAYPRRLRFLDSGGELFQPIPPGADLDETLAALMVPERFLTHEQAGKPVPFAPLDKGQRNLNPEAYTLGRGGGYEVLFHAAWLQPVEGRRSSPWVYIDGGRGFDDHRELEGAVRIYRSRFLHVDFNLWLSRFVPASMQSRNAEPSATETTPPLMLPEAPEPPPSKALQRLRMIAPLAERQFPAADGPLLSVEPDTPGESAVAPERYQVESIDLLQQAQQVGNGNLTYVDHPRMGALVLLTPLEGERDGEEAE